MLGNRRNLAHSGVSATVCQLYVLAKVLPLRGVTLLWKLGGRGSGFENRGLWVLEVQQPEARVIGFRVSSPEYLFNILKSLFMKTHHFGKCSLLIFLYTIEDNNIWLNPRPRTHPKIWGYRSPIPLGWRLCSHFNLNLALQLFLDRMHYGTGSSSRLYDTVYCNKVAVKKAQMKRARLKRRDKKSGHQ